MNVVVRTLLEWVIGGIGAGLVQQGYATADQSHAIIGGIMASVAVFSTYQHKQQLLATTPPTPSSGD